jgi:hypothetical protein
MGATHHPPTPLAGEILQMVSRPLRIAAQSQVTFPVTDELKKSFARDGILGHQLYKLLESLAPCYSQSLLLSDFKYNHTLLWL